MPFAIASTVTLTMGDQPADRVKSASGLFALMRNLGGAIGIAVSATIINDRTNMHFLHIAEHLNFWNTELAGWLHRMSSRYIQAWGDPMIGQVAALSLSSSAVERVKESLRGSKIFCRRQKIPCHSIRFSRPPCAGNSLQTVAAVA